MAPTNAHRLNPLGSVKHRNENLVRKVTRTSTDDNRIFVPSFTCGFIVIFVKTRGVFFEGGIFILDNVTQVCICTVSSFSTFENCQSIIVLKFFESN